MAKVVFNWTVHRLCGLIEEMLSNKFDCFIVIDGERGTGKSTLAYLIMKGVKDIVIKNPDGSQTPHKLDFKPDRDILYTRTEIITAYNERWFSKFMADEMINVSFNRDFYNENQKRLIKIINMNRDHCNLCVACVPQFQTLDSQIKGLCKIRITIVRRGIGIIQTKNKTLYSTDRWDSAQNEKLEKEWFNSGVFKPRYSRLSTFRGVIRFRDLTNLERIEYEEIKIRKRNELKEEESKKLSDENPNDRLYALLVSGEIKSKEIFEKMCKVLQLKPINAMQNIRSRLRNDNNETPLKDFFTDDKLPYEEISRR